MMTKSPGVDENRLAVEDVHPRFSARCRISSLAGKTGIVDGHTIVTAKSRLCQSVGRGQMRMAAAASLPANGNRSRGERRYRQYLQPKPSDCSSADFRCGR
jgi:hypothetical protein